MESKLASEGVRRHDNENVDEEETSIISSLVLCQLTCAWNVT